MHVQRIGYESWASESFEAGPGRAVTRRLEVPVRPVELKGLRVEAERRCRPRAGALAGGELVRVWEEARKALEVARWTEAEGRVRLELRRWEHTVEPETGRIREEKLRREVKEDRRSFFSAPAAELAAEGYVREEDGTYRYFGPDAEVLLSDVFMDHHCFALVRGRDAEEPWVGLTFEPMRKEGLPDVEGVLWVSEETAELRRLEFRYARLEPPPPGDAGGRVEFQRLPGGEWIVSRWCIRMPVTVQEYRPRVRLGPYGWSSPQRTTGLGYYQEEGGEVVGLMYPGRKVEQEPQKWLSVAETRQECELR